MRSVPTQSALTLLATILVAAAPATRPAPEYFSDASGVAVRGYDVVSYFEGKAEPGKPDLTAEHGGATFRFASEAHRDAFKAAPDKYAPQYGGYCAAGMAGGGYKAPTSPDAFSVVDGKLYLNYSLKVRDGWSKDVPGNIAKADAKWPLAKDKPGPVAK